MVSQGQRAGIRSVTVRAVRVIRPGTVSSRRRSVRAAGTTVSGSPISTSSTQQVVRERRDHCPGGVREELPGGEVGECLLFKVTNRELNDRVLAVL